MSKPGRKESPETTQRRIDSAIKRHARELQRKALGLPALKSFMAGGPLHPELANDLKEATEEAHAAALALGAEDGVLTPQRAALLRSFSRLGILERGLLRLWMRSEDPDLASKVATVVRERRGILQTLGLERYAKDILDPTRGVEVEWITEDASAVKSGPGASGDLSPSSDVPDSHSGGAQ